MLSNYLNFYVFLVISEMEIKMTLNFTCISLSVCMQFKKYRWQPDKQVGDPIPCYWDFI